MLLPVALLCITPCVLLPTSKQAAAMFAVPKIINNEKAQELPDNILNLSNAWIKEQTDKIVNKEAK